ncbi:MAG TPA: cytochrome b/b6 domain-containing protein [Syntrophomonadaceae bacterium]|nr:cytochrome b/b6 domain-containing protein [Syntrophomonadaceae bacterium]
MKINPNATMMRFTVGERMVHWIHAVSFLLLLFTGLGVLALFFQPAMNIFGGIQVTRNIHRVVAVIFTLSIFIGFLTGKGGRQLRSWFKDVFTFDKDDFAHAKNFPIEFFGGHRPYPPQGKFNGGEKINSFITILGTFGIVISGYIMWFAPSFPAFFVQWAYPIHSGCALLMAALLIAHFYLGVLHPDSNQALMGMINGRVPEKFAYEHYQKWYHEEKSK